MESTTARHVVPFARPDLGDDERTEVMATLRSGWLTSGPRVTRFERDFAEAAGAPYALAVNSCTAALHLAVEALGLRANQVVLVPTMTFAATAEVVRYLQARPLLVDVDARTGNIDLADAERRIAAARASGAEIVGMIPVHVGGLMLDMCDVRDLARRHGLWIVEDAAHAFPAAWRRHADEPWQRCGAGTADVSCFSFYANKTITTGEGGMATTSDKTLADRMRTMSLHGLSHDAWDRYSGGATWDYQIVAPGFKYNLTDIAAALGIHQLARAESMRVRRESLSARYKGALAGVDAIELPDAHDHRIHAWHLFVIRLRLDRLAIDRNRFMLELRQRGVSTSVHWRPLHLHPYYRQTLGVTPQDYPAATSMFERIVSLPLSSAMTDQDCDYVSESVADIASRFRR